MWGLILKAAWNLKEIYQHVSELYKSFEMCSELYKSFEMCSLSSCFSKPRESDHVHVYWCLIKFHTPLYLNSKVQTVSEMLKNVLPSVSSSYFCHPCLFLFMCYLVIYSLLKFCYHFISRLHAALMLTSLFPAICLEILFLNRFKVLSCESCEYL